jgi:hypothetical protein
MMTAERLADLKEIAIKTAKKASNVMGINMPAAITCVKPEGTCSQVVNTASGAHPRYAKFYIRRYRISSTDPLYKMMKAQGVKFTPENGQGPEATIKRRKELMALGRTEKEARILIPNWEEKDVMTWVVEFPVASPKGCITRHDMDAIAQLEHYLNIKKNWCEQNVSMTVYVKPDEWLKAGSWVYDHFDMINGLSFFPSDEKESHYEQAPYEEITEDEYNKLVKKFPTLDYSKLSEFEKDDHTQGSKELSFAGGKCDL